MNKLLPLVATIVLMTGCVTASVYIADNTGRGHTYDLELIEVEKPSRADQRYSPRKNEKASGLTYSDSMVEVTLKVEDFYCGFALKNKTSHVLKVVWKDTSFVDPDNKNMAVLASTGMAFFGFIYQSEPSVVIPGSELTGMLVPKRIPSEPGTKEVARLGGKHEYPHLFPLEKDERPEKYIGERVRMLLPLEIEGVINDYIFTLEVKGVKEKVKKK